MKYQPGDIIGGVTIGTARDNWCKIATEAHAGLRLDCEGVRPSIRYEHALVIAAVAEILSLRLQAAYAPIFATLAKIERQIGAIAHLRRERWAPPGVNR